jgi:putative ABC transport system ATP-binding protein
MIGLILNPSTVGEYDLGGTIGLDVAAMIQSADLGGLADVRAQHLGFLLQSGGLLPYLNVEQNITLPRRILGLEVSSELVDEAIDRLNLAHLLEKKPHQLSIGERQRVGFVRALSNEPDLLLADEPTGALDPVHARKLFHLIIDVVKKFRIAALLVTHDWDLVKDCAIRNISGHVKESPSRSETVFHE